MRGGRVSIGPCSDWLDLIYHWKSRHDLALSSLTSLEGDFKCSPGIMQNNKCDMWRDTLHQQVSSRSQHWFYSICSLSRNPHPSDHGYIFFKSSSVQCWWACAHRIFRFLFFLGWQERNQTLVFCCCSPSASKFDTSRFLRCFSARRSYEERWSALPWPFRQLHLL